MTAINLQELLAVIEKATPGPWFKYNGGISADFVPPNGSALAVTVWHPANEEFIIALNPEVAKRLVTALIEAREALKSLIVHAEGMAFQIKTQQHLRHHNALAEIHWQEAQLHNARAHKAMDKIKKNLGEV